MSAAMTNATNHKTVFVLDHSAKFAEPCGQPIDFETFCKARQPGIIPLNPVSKSLWCCAVESTLEYCRIAWDIYPQGKLIRYITSDGRTINSWKQEEQHLNKLMDTFATVAPPLIRGRSDSMSILTGLAIAVEKLCEPTELQHERRTSLVENANKVLNKGRIICITYIKSELHLKNIEDCVLDAVNKHNKIAAQSDNLMPIQHCELSIVHTTPISESCIIPQKSRRELSANLSSEVICVQSGLNLANKLCHLVLLHYDLASTTVTGIPMKEEQNANSSANYDVELFHPIEAHTELVKTGSTLLDGAQVRQQKEGAEYETVTLKWCTPRTSAVELQYCIGMNRITPVDVNSRPSSCLTNFLIGGRSVMLELPRKSGAKILSHMLTSHGGEIFVHSLGTSRSTLEDPPSISEGCGGRVTDYRITDFGEFMKAHRLVPIPRILGQELSPIEKAKKQLEKATRYWPLVISNTTVFNMLQHLEPLPKLIMKDELSEYDVTECKKVIYHLVGMEAKNEPLPVPNLGTRGKGPKRDEQYRVMWNELETLVRVHCVTEAHGKVLECLLECRKPNPDQARKPTDLKIKEEKTENTAVALKELDRYSKMSEREKQDFNKGEDIKNSAPLKRKLVSDDGKSAGPQSLLSLWTNRIASETSKRRVEFSGRSAAEGPIAKLYPNLAEAEDMV